jgi:hypothetical protein
LPSANVLKVDNLRVQHVGTHSAVDCEPDDGMFRQQGLQLPCNVGFPWAHIGSVVDDGIAQQDDAFLRH